MIVYKATSPSGKIYIGITSNPLKNRIKEHKKDSVNQNLNRPFHKAIRKYGIDNIKFEVIDKARSWDKLCLREQYWIQFYKSNKRDIGYNCTSGGEGASGRIMSEETKIKISNSNKEYYKNNKEKVKNKDDKVNKINKADATQFSKRQDRVKQSILNGGYSFLVYKKDTNEFVGEWINRTECAKELNIDASHIGGCLSGKRKTHKGYIFIRKNIIDENLMIL